MATPFPIVENAIELSMPPELWEVVLRDGNVLTVIAHGRRVDASDVVFVLLFEGTPRLEVESLRIPLSLLPEDYDLLEKSD